MKRLLVIFLIFSIIFISGCTTEEKTNSFQNNQQSDGNIASLIIEPNELPGLDLGYYKFFAVSKSNVYTFENQSGVKEYEDVLPLGTRNVGQSSAWADKSGRIVQVGFQKYDSNSGLKEQITVYNETLRNNLFEEYDELLDVGNSNIGDSCEYFSQIYNNQPEISQTVLKFVYKNYIVGVMVVDEKAKSKNEAIRIAEIVESRLD